MTEREEPRNNKVDSLIDRGARVSEKIAATGNTSLHICAENDYGTTATLLLKHHIDYTAKNKQGKTAYDLASEKGHQSVMTAIGEKQAEVRNNWQKAKKAKFCTIL